jgi:hypothetical protein
MTKDDIDIQIFVSNEENQRKIDQNYSKSAA